jgi:hypothetical protein
MRYKVGSLITYQPFCGEPRTVLVEEKEADIKNDRSGFAGVLMENGEPTGFGVWGYDSQIVKVDRR